jgi:hypothetical protein
MNIRNKLKNSLIATTIIVFVFSFFVFNISFAQENKESVDLKEFNYMSLEVEADNVEAVNKLQVFWHDLKDRIDLAFTFNKTKKIEKELKFAEKRIRWANVLSAVDSQDKKDLAFKLGAKADEYVNRIVDKSHNAFKQVNEREKNILENILIHQDNKDKVWESLESNIAVENSEDFMRIREQIESKQQSFMEKLANNTEVPGELRERFEEQVQKTKQRRENRQNFIKRNREQLDNLNASNNSELKEFLEKRRQNMMHFNEEFQEEFEDFSEDRQNRNRQEPDQGPEESPNRLGENKNNNRYNINNEGSDDALNMPDIDINSDKYQEFLRMLDSSQPAADEMEAVE